MNQIEWIVVLVIISIVGLNIYLNNVKYNKQNDYCKSVNAFYYRADEDSTPICMRQNGTMTPIQN